MTALIDLNDVPHVDANDLMQIMQTMIAKEHGLIFVYGLTQDAHAALEDTIWERFSDDAGRRLALLVRFECLVGLFASRRLKDQFTQHGLNILAPLFSIVAEQRLNRNQGFNPQKVLMALLEALSVTQPEQTPERIHPSQIPTPAGQPIQLAA